MEAGRRLTAEIDRADLARQVSLKRLKINKNNFTGLEQQGNHPAGQHTDQRSCWLASPAGSPCSLLRRPAWCQVLRRVYRCRVHCAPQHASRQRCQCGRHAGQRGSRAHHRPAHGGGLGPRGVRPRQRSGRQEAGQQLARRRPCMPSNALLKGRHMVPRNSSTQMGTSMSGLHRNHSGG